MIVIPAVSCSFVWLQSFLGESQHKFTAAFLAVTSKQGVSNLVPRTLVFRPLVKGNEARGTRLGSKKKCSTTPHARLVLYKEPTNQSGSKRLRSRRSSLTERSTER